jgi:hypothetical protein
MTIATIMHAVLAVVFWVLRKKLLKRSIWAHRMALLVVGAAVLAIGMMCTNLVWSREPLAAVIFPASAGAIMLYALIQLGRAATFKWFTLQPFRSEA